MTPQDLKMLADFDQGIGALPQTTPYPHLLDVLM
jgi:hypothetical protein